MSSGTAQVEAGATIAPEQSSTTPPAVAAPTQHAAPIPECANCGAPVTGRYCGQCGQRLEHAVHSLWHFTREATEDLTHADSRLWQTLAALLFKPGYLTREFLDGRRASYLPPVRLYIVLSVLFFLVAGVTSRDESVVVVHQTAQGSTSVAAVPLRPGESRQQRAERICGDMQYDGPWKQRLGPLLQSSCRRAVADNGRLREAFLHNVPRAMFVFLPILALVMKLMYWRPRRYYVEHLLFFLNNHAFVFLFVGLYWLVSAADLPAAISTPLRVAVCLYLPYYLYRSMRRVYGQGRGVTLGKLALLSVAYVASGIMMLGVTSIYSVLTL